MVRGPGTLLPPSAATPSAQKPVIEYGNEAELRGVHDVYVYAEDLEVRGNIIKDLSKERVVTVTNDPATADVILVFGGNTFSLGNYTYVWSDTYGNVHGTTVPRYGVTGVGFAVKVVAPNKVRVLWQFQATRTTGFQRRPSTNFARNFASLVRKLQGQQKTEAPVPTAGAHGAASTSTSESLGAISLASNPNGADIELDGNFVGSTPSTISVAGGDHVITVKKNGYKLWERRLKTSTGKVNIAADLEADVKREPNTQAVVPQGSATPVAVRGTGATPSSGALGKIFVTSSPVGAEIYADSLFVGKTPYTMKLKPGQHSILLLMKDYKNWSQTIKTDAGSAVQLTATLEKSN